MKELRIEAKTDRLNDVLAFIDEMLESMDCPMKAQMQLDIAVEEIFVNIAHYAYTHGEGDAVISIESESDPRAVTITFADSGTPYDPCAKEDPDITLSAEDRQIGGLGIYMVKKSMDSMEYERKDNQNVLKIRKTF